MKREIDLEDALSDIQDMDETPLRFGKYKGETPNEVARINPGYLCWFYETVEGAEGMISEELYNKCSEGF